MSDVDIVERLRRRADDSDNQELDREAADEIERLRKALVEAKDAALKGDKYDVVAVVDSALAETAS